MKKVFYISAKPVNNWDFLIPPDAKNSSQMDISILLLEDGVGQENLLPFPVFVLNSRDENEDSKGYKILSYQEFLERVFISDLPLVL